MATSLTVTVADTVVERLEEYARKRQTSVSRLVEEYLGRFSYPRPESVLDGLTGIFHDAGRDYKKQLEDALSEKYLV
ncbi:DUF6364 family protein [Breznakiellaceae bacterium SP9]